MRGLLYVHHCLSEGELEEATLSSLRGLVSYRPLAHCRVKVVVEEVVVVGVRVNFDRFSVVAAVAVEVRRARRRRQVGKAHLLEGSHGPARLDAEPRAILEEGNNFEALFARQAVPHIVDRVRVFVVAAG